jgi:hypothetical protein
VGEAAVGAARTNTFLGDRYRCGGTRRAVRNHVRGLQTFGYLVTLRLAA